MSFKVNALEGYFGGKGGSGTYQQIINLIPPHNTLVIPFLGHCGITRNIKPCQNWYLNDINKDVVKAWEIYWKQTSTLDIFAPNTNFLTTDWRDVLNINMDQHHVVHYLDPTYRPEDRKSKHRYPYELTEADHLEILERANNFSCSPVLISTYDNKVYESNLKGWNKISFEAKTRHGMATETVYFNYEPPKELHDYRYMGNDYRERHDYKRKRKHLTKKFERMTALERSYFMNALSGP